MSHGVKVRDRGWNRIQREFLKIRPNSVDVGIQGTKAAEQHKESKATNVMIASVHEFGYPPGNIPERSFLRSTFDKYRRKYRGSMKQLAQDLISKKISRASGLNMIGEEYRGDVINRVRGAEIKQGLQPETQRRRGEQGPALIDTGIMIGAISVEVKK